MIIFLSIASMPCDPVTPNQYPIVELNPKNRTHHFVLYFRDYIPGKFNQAGHVKGEEADKADITTI